MLYKELTRAQIPHYLGVLSSKVAAFGIEADMFMGGGAAMALITDERPTAQDIDCHVDRLHWRDLINLQVAATEALDWIRLKEDGSESRVWLCDGCEDVLRVLSYKKEKYYQSLVLPDHEPGRGLQIYVLNEAPQLAMKLLRVREKDQKDMYLLCCRLGVRSVDDLWSIWSQHASSFYSAAASGLTMYSMEKTWKAMRDLAAKQGLPPLASLPIGPVRGTFVAPASLQIPTV